MVWLILAALFALIPPATAAEPPAILVFGDSLSAAHGIQREQSWVSLLQQRLDILPEPYRVINASVGGETTDGGLRRLPDTLARVQPRLVILELGGNDGLRGFPLDVIENNLSRMIEQILAAEAKVLLVGMRIPPNYGTRYAEGFHRIYGRLAERHGIALVPFMLDNVATDPALMQSDGIHPQAEAQPRILENIWPRLEDLL